jgi:hypothetical protein
MFGVFVHCIQQKPFVGWVKRRHPKGGFPQGSETQQISFVSHWAEDSFNLFNL